MKKYTSRHTTIKLLTTSNKENTFIKATGGKLCYVQRSRDNGDSRVLVGNNANQTGWSNASEHGEKAHPVLYGQLFSRLLIQGQGFVGAPTSRVAVQK